jgi:ribose transport system substrate-binding protein
MIQDAIKVAIKVLNGETVDAVLVIPTTIVSAENVEQHLDASNNVY